MHKVTNHNESPPKKKRPSARTVIAVLRRFSAAGSFDDEGRIGHGEIYASAGVQRRPTVWEMAVRHSVKQCKWRRAQSARVSQVGVCECVSCFSAEAVQSRRRQSDSSRRTSAPLVSRMPGMRQTIFTHQTASRGLRRGRASVHANQWAAHGDISRTGGGRHSEANGAGRFQLIHSRGWRALAMLVRSPFGSSKDWMIDRGRLPAQT